MREIIARVVSVLSVVLIVGLSFLFAAEHNPPTADVSFDGAAKSPPVEKTIPVAPPDDANGGEHIAIAASSANGERGGAIYAQQKCATCHSIAGEGNPRNPLDGVGARWDPDELRDWVIGDGVAKEVLSQAMIKRKQRYKNMPAEDMKTLVAYLLELKP